MVVELVVCYVARFRILSILPVTFNLCIKVKYWLCILFFLLRSLIFYIGELYLLYVSLFMNVVISNIKWLLNSCKCTVYSE